MCPLKCPDMAKNKVPKKIKLKDPEFCNNFGFTVGEIVKTVPCPAKYLYGSFKNDPWVFSHKYSCPVRISKKREYEALEG